MEKTINVVLLAAGLGTRLRPITDSVPKCLVEIQGIPLLDIWLSRLTQSKGVEKIIVNTHYLAESVNKHIKKHWSFNSNISTFYEASLLGTAGTIRALSSELLDKDTMVVHADNLSFFDLDEFVSKHLSRPRFCDITMMLFTTDNPSACGIVTIDSHNIVHEMYEKVDHPPSNLANAAVYLFSAEVIRWLESNTANDISTDVIPVYLGRILAWKNDIYHRDIGTLESLAKANEDNISQHLSEFIDRNHQLV